MGGFWWFENFSNRLKFETGHLLQTTCWNYRLRADLEAEWHELHVRFEHITQCLVGAFVAFCSE